VRRLCCEISFLWDLFAVILLWCGIATASWDSNGFQTSVTRKLDIQTSLDYTLLYVYNIIYICAYIQTQRERESASARERERGRDRKIDTICGVGECGLLWELYTY
jgi:hypothetical protein